MELTFLLYYRLAENTLLRNSKTTRGPRTFYVILKKQTLKIVNENKKDKNFKLLNVLDRDLY